ncbi:MAG TPA: helicase-associated domain-containing protein [Dehalococcoidia bacterium]|nr:helicase-associated domain-containing protein [Dehalococcoidia bacterium]
MAVYAPIGWLDPATQEIAAALSRLSDAQIVRVTAARRLQPGTIRGVDAAMRRTILATQLTAMPGIQLALAELSRRDLAVLQAVWHFGPVAPERLIERLRQYAAVSDVRGSLQRLEDLLLVIPAEAPAGALAVPAAIGAVLMGRIGGARPAQQTLDSLTSDTLAAICAGMGLTPAKPRKQERLQAVLAALKDGERVRREVAALTKEERELFQGVLELGGTVDGWSLVQRFPKAATRNGYYGYELRLTPQALRDNPGPLLALQAHGLLLPYGGEWAGSFTVVDEVLQALVPPLALGPADFAEPAFAPPPPAAVPAGGQPAPLLDLAECLHVVDETHPALTQRGLFPRPAIKRLARQLGVNDPAYADLLAALALRLRLVEGNAGLKVRPKRAAELLERPEIEGRSALLEAWKELPGWRDDREEGLDRGEAQFTIGRDEREAALTQLQTLPDEGASLASFAARLAFVAPIRFGAAGVYTALAGDSVSPERFARGFLRTLAWLGLAEPLQTSGTPGSPPETVGLRLTPAGRVLLRGEATAEAEIPPRTDRIIVQPTLDILAPPNIAPTVYLRLRDLADLRSATGMRTLTLTRASLRRALDRKATPESIRRLLEQYSDTPLPPTVLSLFDDVERLHGRVRVGQANYYITVDEPHLLVELLADRRLSGLTLRRLSDTVAVCFGGPIDAILETLRGAGHMPVVDGDAAAPRPALRAVPASSAARSSATGQPKAPPSISIDGEDEELLSEAGGRATGVQAVCGLLEDAVARRAVVELQYRGKSNGVERTTRREIEPEMFDGEVAYGYDRTTGRRREFRIERIVSARMTGQRFRPGFN